jgi:hypothetical protein
MLNCSFGRDGGEHTPFYSEPHRRGEGSLPSESTAEGAGLHAAERNHRRSAAAAQPSQPVEVSVIGGWWSCFLSRLSVTRSSPCLLFPYHRDKALAGVCMVTRQGQAFSKKLGGCRRRDEKSPLNERVICLGVGTLCDSMVCPSSTFATLFTHTIAVYRSKSPHIQGVSYYI